MTGDTMVPARLELPARTAAAKLVVVVRAASAADVGVGTVVDGEQLDAAVRAGAHYLVTPMRHCDEVVVICPTICQGTEVR